MKTTLTLMLCALGLFLGTGVTHAQTQVLPNGAGGYNVYGSGGTTQVLPNGAGGYNTYGSNGMTQILPMVLVVSIPMVRTVRRRSYRMVRVGLMFMGADERLTIVC